MNKNNFFCENCRDNMEITIKNIKTFGEIRDKKYYYIGKAAYCSKCNSEIYVSKVVDYNLKELYDVYRKENDIISLKQVQEIPTKYSIDIQNISLLLGWSEQTFSRYFDGDVPTKQCSAILSRIYNDPSYYLELLENNRENLKSRDAYEESRKAIEMLL